MSNPQIDRYADQIIGLAEKIKAENATTRPPGQPWPPIEGPPIVPPDPPEVPDVPPGATTLVFVTEFETAEEWDQTMGSPGIPGVYKNGDWMIPGYPEQITSAACEPGAPGRGQRHWTGAGVNSGSGSLRIEPFSGAAPGECWVELRMRYQQGLRFSQYHKVLYFNVSTPDAMVVDFWGSTNVLIWTNAGSNYGDSSTGGFDSINPYDWFTLLVHVKRDTNGMDGVGELWLNGTQVLHERSVNYNGATWGSFTSLENMSERNAGDPMYIDVSRIRVWI